MAKGDTPVVHMGDGGFSWKVVFPERTSAELGRRKPRADILLTAVDDGAAESIQVPIAVGRSLESKLGGGHRSPTSRAELLYLIRETSVACASDRVAKLVDRRDYSTKEMRDKLSLDGYSKASIDEVVRRACDSGLVDDSRFASVFIRTKVSSGWGAYRIERELGRRGIELDEVEGWPEEYIDDSNEPDRAYELLTCKRLSSKDPYAKAVRFLVSRGFSYGVATSAARRRVEDESEDD
ncbi:MAG: recombination regulator RecX [Atopobiaceae bacterium]|jgi:regulatory protein|nr:recombination regulator RecX [Atopobiaceae bacterium]MCI2173240.1 recombination regulator RecX [Atopobiaceae bacterium]MCI2207235.1 recombination regulator RecX [Atopobiaceae bacterium]